MLVLWLLYSIKLLCKVMYKVIPTLILNCMMHSHLISHLSIKLVSEFVLCSLSECVRLFLFYLTSNMSFNEEIMYELKRLLIFLWNQHCLILMMNDEFLLSHSPINILTLKIVIMSFLFYIKCVTWRRNYGWKLMKFLIIIWNNLHTLWYLSWCYIMSFF